MKAKVLLHIGIWLLLFTACSPLTTISYEDHATRDDVLAILPFENIYTGRVPPTMSTEQVDELEVLESIAFQYSLYDQLMRKSGIAGDDIMVRFQHPRETNRILEDNGYTIADSWTMPTEELSNILGVDAMVRSTVRKNQYLTNLESFAVDMGLRVASSIFTDLGVFTRSQLSKTSDVWISSSILYGRDASPMWNLSRKREANWTWDHREIVDHINRAISRRFPYRAHEFY